MKIIRIHDEYRLCNQINNGRDFSNFAIQALRGNGITLNGNGNPTRLFCDVFNLVDEIIRLPLTILDITGPNNSRNPQEYSTQYLAKKVTFLIDLITKAVAVPLILKNPRQRESGVSLTSKIFGRNLRLDFKDGFNRTVEDFRKRIVGGH